MNIAIARNVFGTAKQITRSGNGKSVTRTYVHDANERLCKTIEPEIGATVQDYDLASNVAWKAIGLALPSTTSCDIASVPANKKITYGYDALNRISSTTYGDASPSISRTYTPDGLPLTMTSNGTTWTYAYNKRRLLETESLVYGGVTYAIGRNYDTHGNQSRLTYPDGAAVDLAPNALGQPTKVGTYAIAVSYHPNGAIAGFTYGNGITHSLTQNARGLPDVSTDVGVLKDKYAFDANANVTGITDSQESISTRSMTYDGLDRLLTASAPSMWGSATYSYDALDNLTSATLSAGGTARTTTMNYPDPNTNRLASISGTAGYAFSYGYDSQGNITQRGAQTYVFDQGNRIQQVTGKATYIYDGWGRRTSVVGTDGVNRVQVYSQDGQILYMKPTSAAGTKYIYLHKHVIAEVGPNGTQYQHTDGLGSPVARTTSGGALQSRTRYEPYGYVAAGSTPVIGFAGHVNDAESGLTYMQQRFYDPVAGRFLSIDPVTTDVNTGESFNRYAYANNSPYKYVDPDGRQSIGSIPTTSRMGYLDLGIRAWYGELKKYGTAALTIVSFAMGPEAVGPEAIATSTIGRSTVEGLKLEKALASEAQTAKVLAGEGEVIAGAGTKVPYRDAGRLAEQHGGKPADWQKVSGGNHVAKDGTKIETHAAQNKDIGKVVELKTKLKDEGQP